MQDLVVFDMDGVIADIRHRYHFIDQGTADWDGFFSPEECAKDVLIEPTRLLMAALESHLYVGILTARPERILNETRDWLKVNGIHHDYLWLRPDGDHSHQSAGQWKRQHLARTMDWINVLGFYDDSLNNVKEVGALGIPSILYALDGAARVKTGEANAGH